MKEVINDNFEQVINESDCVVIDISAKWCHPCKTLIPIIENISKIMLDVEFYKVDVEESPEIASKYSIKNIPAILFFKGGKLMQTHVGMIQEKQLIEKITAVKNG